MNTSIETDELGGAEEEERAEEEEVEKEWEEEDEGEQEYQREVHDPLPLPCGEAVAADPLPEGEGQGGGPVVEGLLRGHRGVRAQEVHQDIFCQIFWVNILEGGTRLVNICIPIVTFIQRYFCNNKSDIFD